MLKVDFFLDLVIILLSTKLLGLISRKAQMPQVVGALLAGILIGPAVLNIVSESEFIEQMAELGVITLMFAAGLETDIHELKKCGKASFIIAIIGVAVPLFGGFVVTTFFFSSFTELTKAELLQNIFIGVILTATSVSITVETLREMGKLKTPVGTAILGAAVIDDILGIVILTIISSFTSEEVSVLNISLRIGLFFILAVIIGFIFSFVFKYLCKKYGRKRRIPVFGFIFCLILSYVAERFFGITDITGAYLAGIIISTVSGSTYIFEKMEVMSYMLLSPMFFASIGIKTQISSMNGTMILFTVALLAVAILTKIVGCGLGARACGYSKQESRVIGIGMVSRGEVALIVANQGAAVGLMKSVLMAPVVIVVIVTTLATPIILKLAYRGEPSTPEIAPPIDPDENLF